MSVLRCVLCIVGWGGGGEVRWAMGDGGVAFPVVLFWCCKPRGPAVELGALQPCAR